MDFEHVVQSRCNTCLFLFGVRALTTGCAMHHLNIDVQFRRVTT